MSKVKVAPQMGGDPEFFIANTKGVIIPSCGLIGGEKGEGVPVNATDLTCKWLEDNVAVELNFTPADDGDVFTQRITRAMLAVNNRLNTLGYTPVFKPSHNFAPKDLVHAKALTFGCDPDFCAYDPVAYNADGPKARTLDASSFTTERYCGGHLHFSLTNKDKIPSWVIAMMLDAYVGLPMVALEPQGSRRKTYGLAGLYRPKAYGIEYRTLSNAWLRKAHQAAVGPNADDAIMWLRTFSAACLSLIQCIEADSMLVSKWFTKLPNRDIQRAINSEDKNQAREIYRYCQQIQEARELSLFARII